MGEASGNGGRVGAVRWQVILSLLVVTPAGLLLKAYPGPGRQWVNNYAAAVLYELFWCLALYLVWPRRRYAGRIAAAVLIATCLLEVLQLWGPPLLTQVRTTWLGRALLGTTFCWWDFPHYVAGCGLGWLWLVRLG